MNEQIKDPSGGIVTQEQYDEAMKKLADFPGQLENLNKGIAGYRDEAKKAKEAATAAAEALEAIKQENEKKSKKAKADEVELSPEDEKKFEVWAEKQGFVTSEELAKERARLASESAKGVASTAVSEFLEKHPEYDDDEKWQEVQTEFNLYKTPGDLAGYRALLERVHKNLNGDSSKERGRAEEKADIIKRSRLSLGGGGRGSGDTGDAATIESLQKKYPNLSREQIEARLTDIRALYPDKK